MSDIIEEIRQAISTDIARARELIREELKRAPTAELYFLASKVAISDEQRKSMLQKAVDLDPFHADASMALEQMQRSVAASPPPPTYQPPGFATGEMERAVAANKSYVGASITTFVAYIFFWLPGLIFNIMYLNDARQAQKVAGRSLPGVGCLWFMLIVQGGGLLLLCVLTGGLGILSS
jgi:hypothetical protein